MKNIQKTIIKSFLLLSAMILSSCNNDLDLEPEGELTASQLYKTEADAIAGVTAVYSALSFGPSGEQSLYGRNLYFLTDMASDYAAAGASASNPNVQAISTSSHDANNDRVDLAWKQIYKGINRANVAIDNIPKVTGSETLKQRLINEAKFIRALLYFDLVQLWGPVPLVLHEAESLDNSVLKADRKDTEIIYQQIISDLTAAEALPASYSGTDLGRATVGAAKALLSKVYLVRREWDKAQQKAEEVINGGYGYDLFEDFGDAFRPATKNGKEHIFSIQFELGQSGTGTGNTLPGVTFNGFTNVEPADIISDTSLFYDIYDDDDTRKNVSYVKSLINPATGDLFTFLKPRFSKYIDYNLVNSGQSNSLAAMNFPVIRYSEVLLILAEAINEQSGPTTAAYDAINQVRRRAYNQPLYSPSPYDLTGLDQTTFREALQKERLLEFVQEGQRWFDLVRWGILVESLKKVPAKAAGVSDRNYLFPIPQTQHDLNPTGLWQNPGY
ncbi:MAG: RagB/SusD family nutrient uptake outer membrane protein [Flavobacteriaceae bacterium]|jgi:hypothetical protein|nr:RagB/SusD family nutrient uptake outer membrane protein [Flavobacteriaceae bacterium]